MNLICIDIGNTNIVVGKYSNHKLIKIIRMATNQTEIDKNININQDSNIAISSVVPKIEKFLLEKFHNFNSIFSVSHINSSINLNVDSPDEVGNDRICNMKSIINDKLYPAIIVDFGSATTYDVIDENGYFIGGAIAPGIDVSAKYLFEKAAQLNKVDFEFPKSSIGKNTTTNLQSGIMYSGVDSINGMLNRIKQEMNNKIKNIILTGGFATILSKHIQHQHILDSNLTLKGIKLIWKQNQLQ